VTIQRGDLITVALRGDAGKPRPALVIQADHFVDLSTVVVLPLTSTLLDLPLVRVTIEPLPATGLQQRSQVMISRPQFAPRARLGPVIGSIDTGTLLEVTRRLAVLLGIG
jgi:mRNA interferase MazF